MKRDSLHMVVVYCNLCISQVHSVRAVITLEKIIFVCNLVTYVCSMMYLPNK